MKKKITLDARWLASGIGTYTKHLLAGVSASGGDFELHAITQSEYLEAVGQWCARVSVVDAPMYTLREQLAVPRAVNGCNLLHVPHYNAPLLYRGPLLVSILDLIHVMDPTYSGTVRSWVYARPMLNLVARKAERIVTISEYSKTQIVERLGVPASKVEVVYCGVDGQFQRLGREESLGAVREALRVRREYVLYVGSLKPYKNVSTLLRAFALLRDRRDIPYELVILGDDSRWRNSLIDESTTLRLEGIAHFVPHVPQELLAKVYASADLLVMPSRIEGFGLPVLEAMASGTPVICSRAASLPEVGGDAVLYFDPASDEELADVMERVLDSKDMQACLRTKGLERAKRFTWEQSTRKHVELYKQILGVN